MLLHHDEELFREVIQSTAAEMNMPIPIVEKDYYVTMLLRELAKKAPDCVFKGGTSLSKCYHAIDRFSEDIDIAFPGSLTQGQRRKLKNEIIADISKELEMPIADWNQAKSRHDYNCYTFSYEPISGAVPNRLIQGVKMEVALGATSFPTIQLPVDSYVYQYLSLENMDIAEEYGLKPFQMNLQSLERTLIDKVFALCDYYLTGKIKCNSRHIYDIYMLLPRISMDDEFSRLMHQVRAVRAEMGICPSAQPDVDVPALLERIVKEKVYAEDYETITTYFQNHPVCYNEAITALEQIAESKVFY